MSKHTSQNNINSVFYKKINTYDDGKIKVNILNQDEAINLFNKLISPRKLKKRGATYYKILIKITF
jgi:hypothetical protein